MKLLYVVGLYGGGGMNVGFGVATPIIILDSPCLNNSLHIATVFDLHSTTAMLPSC
jgi:hypothetical protein